MIFGWPKGYPVKESGNTFQTLKEFPAIPLAVSLWAHTLPIPHQKGYNKH